MMSRPWIESIQAMAEEQAPRETCRMVSEWTCRGSRPPSIYMHTYIPTYLTYSARMSPTQRREHGKRVSMTWANILDLVVFFAFLAAQPMMMCAARTKFDIDSYLVAYLLTSPAQVPRQQKRRKEKN